MIFDDERCRGIEIFKYKRKKEIDCLAAEENKLYPIKPANKLKINLLLKMEEDTNHVI
jgi:hypothetical protein